MSAEKKTDFHVVNHSLPRRDGRVKVTGKAQYVADLRLIGMAYAKVLRSTYAHAKIISIDRAPKRVPVFIASSPAMTSKGSIPTMATPSKITRSSPSRRSVTPENRWPPSWQ